MTRPHVASAVGAVESRPHNPSKRHWKAAMKIFAYLKKTKDLRLLLTGCSNLRLFVVYVDVN